MLAFNRHVARQSRAVDPRPWRTALFAEQQALFDDDAREVTACCTRRAGKTEVAAAKLVDELQRNPELPCVYITLTAKTSRDNLESRLNALNSKHSLGLHHSSVENRWYNDKGGFIWLVGVKDKAEAEKLRGLKYSLVIIDEGGTHRDAVLEYVLRDVLSAAMTDADGQLWLIGTPAPIPSGYFWAVSTGKDKKVRSFSSHAWSVIHNIHHRLSKPGALEAHRLKLGWAEDDPTWVREYLGKWVLDTRALIYTLTEKNEYVTLPPAQNVYTVLGVDLGYDDECAFTICTQLDGKPEVYIQRSYGKSQLLPDQIAAEIRELRIKYNPVRIMCDSGGLGKTIVKQLQEHFNLPVEAAEKVDKAGWIKRVQSYIAAGYFKVGPDAQLLRDEAQKLTWNESRDGHREGCVDHGHDSTYYAFRQMPWLREPGADVEREETHAERFERHMRENVNTQPARRGY